MAHGALRSVRRHRINLANLAQSSFDRSEPFGMDAIVIAKQDDHRRILAKNGQVDKRGYGALDLCLTLGLRYKFCLDRGENFLWLLRRSWQSARSCCSDRSSTPTR